MQKRALGATGIEVSALALGTWGLSGDGYGPVAEIILAHHERIDGKGYPRGLAGDEIPELSRIISVADTYDVMTARDSYRTPMSSQDAIEELRRVAGKQLDARFVEVFIELLEGKDVSFQHSEAADFEKELALEARVEEGHAEGHGILDAGVAVDNHLAGHVVSLETKLDFLGGRTRELRHVKSQRGL